MELVVGRIRRAHGVRGAVAVEVRTDSPDERFAAGSVLATDPADRGPLVVRSARWHSGQLLVRFVGYDSREDAEVLRGTLLLVDSETLPDLPDPDEFYDHQLVGLAAVLPDGAPLGTVDDVVHAGNDLLVIRRPDDGEVLVPFVRALVPTVDLAAGRLVVNPPEGLLEL